MMRLWVEVVTHIRIYLTRKHLTLDVCNNSEIKVILEMGKNCGKKKKKIPQSTTIILIRLISLAS